MDWQKGHCKIDLTERPEIVHMGYGVHGRHPVDSYHLSFWTLHLYAYPCNLILDSVEYPIRFGHVGIIPPWTRVEYHYLQPECRHVYVHFKCKTQGNIDIPFMQDFSKDYSVFTKIFEDLLRVYVINPNRAEVKLWDLLWELTERFALSEGHQNTIPSTVRTAMELIEQRLSEDLFVSELSQKVGYSHNHLNRLFKQSIGKTVKEYILVRRMEQAKHLLKDTDLPVKRIAWECGIPDIQQFNKTVRKYLGVAPSKFR